MASPTFTVRRLARPVLALALVALLTPLAGPPPAAARSAATVKVDFNKDGYEDLAIGIPSEDVETSPGVVVRDAGAVLVLYGSSAGLRPTAGPGDQSWRQGGAGLDGTAEPDDRFGATLAIGDFNKDGYSDLAIGVPGEDVGAIVDAGAVNVLYGGPNGLTATGDQLWNQGASPAGALQETPEARDWFGASLAAGDFNDDGYADLAIGAPREDVTVGGASVSDAGAVQVIYGSATGLAPSAGPGNQLWNQNRGLTGQPEAGDRFGESLAAADFNDDRRADLAIGVPGEDVSRATTGRWPSSTAPRAASPARPSTPAGNSCTRGRRACATRSRPTTPSARSWRSATSTTTARPTWRSASPSRMSATRPTPARSTCSTGPPPA